MQITHEDFLLFIDRAFDGMLKIVEDLGDERANMRPDLPGANSPYAILFHCVGVANFWIGSLLAGRQVHRDRDAEFRAQGMVAEIRQLVVDLKRQLREDIKHVQGDKPLAFPPPPSFNPMREYANWTQGAALIHALEEFAQHHGQMELTRDIITSGTRG
jgi:hypothetical protein